MWSDAVCGMRGVGRKSGGVRELGARGISESGCDRHSSRLAEPGHRQFMRRRRTTLSRGSAGNPGRSSELRIHERGRILAVVCGNPQGGFHEVERGLAAKASASRISRSSSNGNRGELLWRRPGPMVSPLTRRRPKPIYESTDEFRARETGSPAHVAMVTRWMLMNSNSCSGRLLPPGKARWLPG